MLSERYGYALPFPLIPNRVKEKYSASSLSLRLFGLFENDLKIDFERRPDPYVITQILECCTCDERGAVPEQDFFWDLTVGKRTECLLVIAMSGGQKELSLYLRCLNESCREPMEVDISLGEIVSMQARADAADLVIIPVDSDRLMIRKPTGRHQLEWLKGSFSSENAATKEMIRALLRDSGEAASDEDILISDELSDTINDALEEADPLVGFSLTAHCPHCRHGGHHAISLEELSLRELHKSQLNLLQTIHSLAAHYHWSEQQILSIPVWRRSHYLSLIEKEGAR